MVDVNVNVNVKVPALEKLVDYAASSIGAVAGPMLAPWKAHKEAKARRIEATAQADSQKIIADAQADARRALVAPDDAASGILEIGPEGIRQWIEFQERKRHANIVSVVRDAAEELGDKEIPDHEPDHDWTARFFDCVQDVSSEDMRGLWAKILSGEVEFPGRTSLQTLDILRNMTTADARVFKNWCDFVLTDRIIFAEFLEKSLLSFSHELEILSDRGLISHAPGFGVNLGLRDSQKHRILYYRNLQFQIERSKNSPDNITAPGIRLTSAGTELYRIFEHNIRMDYLQSFAAFLDKGNYKISYKVEAGASVDGNEKHSEEYIMITPKVVQYGIWSAILLMAFLVALRPFVLVFGGSAVGWMGLARGPGIRRLREGGGP